MSARINGIDGTKTQIGATGPALGLANKTAGAVLCRFKINQFTTNTDAYVFRAGGGFVAKFEATGNSISFHWQGAGGLRELLTGYVVPTNQWVTAVFTWNKTEAKKQLLYINGVEVASGTTNENSHATTLQTPFFGPDTDEDFDVAINEIAGWAAYKTAAKILTLNESRAPESTMGVRVYRYVLDGSIGHHIMAGDSALSELELTGGSYDLGISGGLPNWEWDGWFGPPAG